jgi:hypothetical protein
MEPDLIDPRTMSAEVYRKLDELSKSHENDRNRRKEQCKQALETYTYLATWGLLRLKAEEFAMKKEGWKDIVRLFFQILEDPTISNIPNLSGEVGLATLSNQVNMPAETYLGLTGLALKLAKEFAFWASAIYADVKAEAVQEQ